MRSVQRKTNAQVIPIRPVGFRVQNALGGCCALCGWDRDLRVLSPHRVDCQHPYDDWDCLAPCPCGERIAHVILSRHGADWFRERFELRCPNCQVCLNGRQSEYDLDDDEEPAE